MSPSPRWEAAPFALSYRVGETVLFARTFRALVLGNHFLDLAADPWNPAPPLDRLGSDIGVIVTRSHPVKDPLPDVTVFDENIRYVYSRYNRYYTLLSGDFETYLGKFGAKARGTLRRKARRFMDGGAGCEVREFKRPEHMQEFHTLARAVSSLTYQEKKLDAGIPDGEEFLKSIVELATRNSVRGYVLLAEAKPIAYLCCPAVGDVLLYSYLGYDPRCAALSPGTVLQYFAFELLFAEKVFRVFDFTEGEGEHKRFFATGEVSCADICYFPNSASTRSWVELHRALDRVSVGIVHWLDTVGLKTRLKRLLRGL